VEAEKQVAAATPE